jgi:hypothetical protein
MKSMMHKMVVATVFGLAAGGAGAAVTVNYVAPDKFADLPYAASAREATLRDLTGHFAKLGSSLAPGQDLRIEVLDVDLAGHLVPSVNQGGDVRVLGDLGTDSPRVSLRFSLEQDGQVIKSGEVKLSDVNYLKHRAHYWDNEPLRHEKTLIDQWFGQTFEPPARTASR